MSTEPQTSPKQRQNQWWTWNGCAESLNFGTDAAAHTACSTLVNELGARLCRRQQWQRATAAAANVQQSCTLAAAVFACLWAGALERVQRQRSRADACVIVSQPRQARKRQKRAEAAEARRVGGQVVFADRIALNTV